MKTLVASHNPDLARDFDRHLLRRRDLRLKTAHATDDLLASLHEGADLCLLDRVLPDGDAVTALASIRAEPKLAALPVVLMVSRGAPGCDREAARARGFADLIELPAAPDALGLLVGRLLGVPLRGQERFPVRLHVFRDPPEDEASYLGTSIDLSENGMLLKARHAALAGSTIGLRFSLPGRTGELSLRGRVVRVDSRNFAPQHALALAFTAIADDDRAALCDYLRLLIDGRPLALRRVVEGGRTLFELSGTLRADSDLSTLCAEARWLRLRDLCRLSADGIQRWIDFARALPPGEQLHLVECPISFIQHANHLPSLLDRQQVESFFAPYLCPACGLDEEHLVDVRRDLAGGARRTPPPARCSGCGAPLSFDELSDQYFAFLDR